MKGLEYRALNDMIRAKYNADRTAIQLNGSTLCGKKYCCVCVCARVLAFMLKLTVGKTALTHNTPDYNAKSERLTDFYSIMFLCAHVCVCVDFYVLLLV